MTVRWPLPTGLDAVLLPAGEWWDAVRVPVFLGEGVLARLGPASGAVIRDPYGSRLYWLIEPRTAREWTFCEFASVQVLGTASWVTVPPGTRRSPPGPHWAVPCTPTTFLTPTSRLHAALHTTISHALGPRQGTAT
ncbi:hypothetical protein [Streptomyces iconiensis]|uniref:Uncharacterized protein n=1 Tax=Streptomyces iconiensis TaxID=1384038 RepID=A0ABT6ZYL5_9ACTN|nr:hypothetical protein [Streptomyces iconiensis]MDJ1134145.1 hypothetical protein [Streptomyces iconiensis]